MDFEGKEYDMKKKNDINTKFDLYVSWYAFVLDG